MNTVKFDKVQGAYTILLLILVLAILAGAWYYFKPKPAQTGQYVTATVAPEMKAIPKITIHPKALKVYVSSTKLKLPDTMKNQPVIAATEVKTDLHPQTVVTTVNPDTGETTTIVRRDAYKLLQAIQTGEMRLSYGYRGTERMARLSATEYLVQVKGINLGVEVAVDSDKTTFAGIGISYKW
jgi:hypothetical protein